MSDYEPPAEQIEALAKELHDAGRPAYGDCYPFKDMTTPWHSMMRAEARFVLRRQHEREEAILTSARLWMNDSDNKYCKTCKIVAEETLAAHAKLDAPKVPEAPTLLEAAKAMLRYPAHEHCERWLALEAAVEREEKR